MLHSVFSPLHMIPSLFFSLFPPPTHSFFSKEKQSISMSFYVHCMSRLADKFLLFSSIKGRKEVEEKKMKNRIKREHAQTVWKKE